jgi:predicted PurR-regulated permease PerM
MEDRKLKISISSGTIVKTILWLIVFYVLFYIKDIILVVLAAVVLASAIEPATNWCIRRHIRRLPAVVGIYLTIGLLLAAFFVLFVPSVLSEALTYVNNLPDSINLSDLWSPLSSFSFFGSHDVSALPDQTISLHNILDASRDAISGTSAGAFRTASLIFGGALGFILTIVLSFYLAVQEDGVGSFLKIVTPLKHHDYIIDLWKRSQKKIGYWMQGQLLLGLIVGILVYLGLMVLGIKHALLLASIAAVFELIPVFGPILSAVPAILMALVDVGTTQAFLVIGLYLIIHQFENHLLYPLVVRKIVGISPMMVILALVIGLKLAGFLGILLSVPVASVVMEWIEDYEKHKNRKVAEG